jgi:hypothetical protein
MPISFTQTSTWASMNRYYNGLEPVYLDAPGVFCWFGYDKKHSTLTSHGGPVIQENLTLETTHDFLNLLLKFSQNKAIKEVHFRALEPFSQASINFKDIFEKYGFQRQAWQTLIIDLSPPEEALFMNLEHSARKGIKKAISLGVQVESCDSFEEYHANYLVPYLSTTNREYRGEAFYKEGWELDTDNIYKYWVARSAEGELLGFLGTYSYDGVATEIASALTPLAFEKKIPVQDLLHWEIIKYHKNKGDHYFDLAGIHPNPTTTKEQNIRKFKEKWGGTLYDVPTYSLDNRSFLHKLINKIRAKLHA